jgi:hypothetical protein
MRRPAISVHDVYDDKLVLLFQIKGRRDKMADREKAG